MVSLDSIKIVQKHDKSNMLGIIESFPKQCADARSIGEFFKLPDAYMAGYRNIVVTGLGGSAIGADLARSYISCEAKVPLLVNRNYTLPEFVGPETLVIASSYSGNTEETLSSYKDAKSKGAKILAITSGGELQNKAAQDGFPVITIPGGLPPRCALGYSFFPLLVLLSKLKIVEDKSRTIDEMIVLLSAMAEDRLGQGVPEKKNPAKKIARELYSKFVIIYGGQDHTDSVVTRWRGQLAENSKTLASTHIFPEMNHNEIVGWENPKKVFKDLVVVILRDSSDHPRTAKRMDITKGIIKKEGVRVIEVNSVGKDLLSRIFSLIYMGDFTSYYLAILNKRDPTPVERVTYLKKELAKI